MDNGQGSNLEIVIDRMLLSARSLRNKIDTIKDHNGDLQQVDYMLKVRHLEKENQELRQALEDHQYGLEFIMSKYRSQVFELIRLGGGGAQATNGV